jgi:hypothetical protein
MFKITVYREATSYPGEGEYPEQVTDPIRDYECDDLEDLIDTLRSQVSDLASWGEWSSSHPKIIGGERCDWLTSHEDRHVFTGEVVRYSVHISPPKGVGVAINLINDAMSV